MARKAPVILFASVVAITAANAQAQTRSRQGEPAKPASQNVAARKAAEADDLSRPRPGAITSTISLADIGYATGFRFANLGGRRDLFVSLPAGADVTARELVLTVDDVSAHEARRSLEVLLNNRSVAAIALDGKAQGRTIRIPLGNARPKDGFLKFSFIYSGAATPDRCIDTRYVGDSLTVRAESAVDIDIAFTGSPDIATTVALLPHDVAIVLPRRPLLPADIATALTVARALAGSGRRVSFHHGFEGLPEIAKRDERPWTRGLVAIGLVQEVMGYLDSPIATMAGPAPTFGALTAVRIGGMPALIVSDASAARAGRMLASPSLNAVRGVSSASIGDIATPKLPTGQVTFERLGLVLPQADVFGRADLPVTLDTRALPPATKPSRLLLDVMVAPDGAGEKAVVSAFVNERLIDSVVALSGERTRLDLPLSDGTLGTSATVRAVVQRRSAAGDCRFEPQGYPAQILGSSAVVLEGADARAHDFSDLVSHWAQDLEVLLPAAAAERPLAVLDLVAKTLAALAADTARINVKFTPPAVAPSPGAPFIAISDLPPAGASPRVRFDRGRVAVADKSGQPLLDLGGYSAGAVAQVINAGEQPGLWIKPLSGDGALPAPDDIKLDRGDVAFLDKSGVALALSTERDTLVRVSYPDQVSWLTMADRFRSWIIGSVWLFAAVGFLYALQRMLRRKPQTGE